MARVMLNSKKPSSRLWVEAMNTTCYTINKVYLRPGTTNTPYEIWKGKKSNLSYFHIFGCIYYIMNDREQLGKFQPKSDNSIFLGYSLNSHSYRVYNLRTQTTMESINVELMILMMFQVNPTKMRQIFLQQTKKNNHWKHKLYQVG